MKTQVFKLVSLALLSCVEAFGGPPGYPIPCPAAMSLVLQNPYYRVVDGKAVLQLERIAERFHAEFGEKPDAIYLVGTHAENAAEPTSDVDLYLQAPMSVLARWGPIQKHEGKGFHFFKALNPGRIPEGFSGLGLGSNQTMLGDGTRGTQLKVLAIDPYVGSGPPNPDKPSRKLWP